MSSYLNFYIVPKQENKESNNIKPIRIFSYSRNSDLYQAFNDNLSIAYYGIEDPIGYSELTSEEMDIVLNSEKEEFNKFIKYKDNKIKVYKEFEKCNITKETYDEIFQETLSDVEYIENRKDFICFLENFILFLKNILDDSEVEKILMNID